MALDLLCCSICPKLPTFSDLSHLLTHVSSKGHLAHLHKLQVRSHQETAAGYQLAQYNQWFQHHGVAQLLSERLFQKETRRANKRAANQRRGATIVPSSVKPELSDEDSKDIFLAPEPLPTAQHTKKNSTYRRSVQRRSGLVRLSPYTPVRRSSRRGRRMLTPAPFAPTSSPDGLMPAPRNHPSESIWPEAKSSPQLKGTVWPGMAMFDSAPEEMKRKRNQKKDISVLLGIQEAASQVEPFEVVHSANGIVLKERHMDDLENDSLVEGESELMRPSPKKRRLLSLRTSSSVRQTTVKRSAIRRGRYQVKVEKRTPVRETWDRDEHTLTSATADCKLQLSRFGPTADEKVEFKLPLEDLDQKGRASNAAIFQDTSSGFGVDGPAENLPNPFLDAIGPSIKNPLSQLAYASTSWLRTQGQPFEQDNPLRALQQSLLDSDYGLMSSPNKENNTPTMPNTAAFGDGVHINPLFLSGSSVAVDGPKVFPFDQQYLGMNGQGTSAFDQAQDHFNNFVNPLTIAMDQMHHNPLSSYHFNQISMIHGQGNILQQRPALYAP